MLKSIYSLVKKTSLYIVFFGVSKTEREIYFTETLPQI